MLSGSGATLQNIGLDGGKPLAASGSRLQRGGARAAALLRSRPKIGASSQRSATACLLADALDAVLMWAEVGDAALARLAQLAVRIEDIGHPLIANALTEITRVSGEQRPQAVLVGVYLLALAEGLDRRIDVLA